MICSINTYLVVFSAFIVGFIALWIAIFMQSKSDFFTMQYKLLILATIINAIILSFVVLNIIKKNIENKILEIR